MKKGGSPSGQRAATQKRLRDKDEEKTPDAKTQREEDDKEATRIFFSRDTGRQPLPIIEMSVEPSVTPAFTRTSSLQDPLVVFDPPSKKLQDRVDGQVYTPADGSFRRV